MRERRIRSTLAAGLGQHKCCGVHAQLHLSHTARDKIPCCRSADPPCVMQPAEDSHAQAVTWAQVPAAWPSWALPDDHGAATERGKKYTHTHTHPEPSTQYVRGAVLAADGAGVSSLRCQTSGLAWQRPARQPWNNQTKGSAMPIDVSRPIMIDAFCNSGGHMLGWPGASVGMRARTASAAAASAAPSRPLSSSRTWWRTALSLRPQATGGMLVRSVV